MSWYLWKYCDQGQVNICKVPCLLVDKVTPQLFANKGVTDLSSTANPGKGDICSKKFDLDTLFL